MVCGMAIESVFKQEAVKADLRSHLKQAHTLWIQNPVRDRSAHYEAEWLPTHGYRGEGFWSVTRKAVEHACVSEGLELSDEEINEGTNIWFYSGVTLLCYDEPYGSGWTAFLAWFEEVTGESRPTFDEAALKHALNSAVAAVREQ